MLGRQRQPQRLSLTLCDTLFPWERHFTLIVWMGKKHKDGFLGFSILASDLTFRYCCLCNHLFLFTWWKKKILSNTKWGRSGKKCVGIFMYEHRRVMSPTWFSAWSVRLISYHIRGNPPLLLYNIWLHLSLLFVSSLSCSSHTKAKAQFSILDLKTLLKYSSCSCVNMVFQSPTLPGLLEENKAEEQILIAVWTIQKKNLFFLEISCNHLNNKANVAHVATPRSL